MAVKQYKLSDGNPYLSDNFRVSEFACKNGANIVLIDDNLVALLQRIRNHFGKTVHINSAYRTPAHNASVGGATYSQHIYGTAADIWVSGVSPLELVQYASYLLRYVMPVRGGVGLYSWGAHVDTRGYMAFWPNAGGYGYYQGSDNGGNVTVGGSGSTPTETPPTQSEAELQKPAEEVDTTLNVGSETPSTPVTIRYRYVVKNGKVWQSIGTTNDDGTTIWGELTDTGQSYNETNNSIAFNDVVNGTYRIKAQTQLEYGDIVIPCVDAEGNNYTAQTENFDVIDKPGIWVWGNDYQYSYGGSGDLNEYAYVPSQGKELQPIKASMWNLFTDKINQLRKLKGLSEISFTPALGKSNYSTESCNFTPAIYNEAANAINDLGGYVPLISSNTELSASLFKDLRDEFNDVVSTLD